MSNPPPSTPSFCDECHCAFICCVNKGTEDKEKAPTSTSEVHGYNFLFCQSCYGIVHLIFLIIFLIAVIIFLVFLLGFELRIMVAGPNILCLDGMIHWKGVLIAPAVVCYVVAIVASTLLACPRTKHLWYARCAIGGSSLSLLVGVVLPAIPVILSWSLQSHIFVRDFNGSLYYCPFTLSSVSSNPVLFSEDMANSSEFICEFWSSQQFCRTFWRHDYDLIPWINMSGTYGAYNCQPLYSENTDPCSTYVNTFMLSSFIEFICTPFFVFIFPVIYRACSSSSSDKISLYTDGRDICGCECLRSRETEPLISSQ